MGRSLSIEYLALYRYQKMLSLTKIFYCLTKNVNLKSRPSENFLADFCTSESSKNQPDCHALRIAEVLFRLAL